MWFVASRSVTHKSRKLFRESFFIFRKFQKQLCEPTLHVAAGFTLLALVHHSCRRTAQEMAHGYDDTWVKLRCVSLVKKCALKHTFSSTQRPLVRLRKGTAAWSAGLCSCLQPSWICGRCQKSSAATGGCDQRAQYALFLSSANNRTSAPLQFGMKNKIYKI